MERIIRRESFKGKEGKYVPEGMITSLATPFTSQGELDELVLQQLIEWQIKAGIHGLLTTAGCGEYVNMDDEERKRALEVALKTASGRVPVIAGILATSTRHAVELAKHAESVGASAVLVLTPYYINPSMDGVYRHFATIAERTSIPIVLYNNPSRTKIDIDVDTLYRLADIPTVVGLKECQRDIGLVSERIRAVRNRIAVLAGDDDLTLPMYALGGRGDVAITTLIAPEPAIEMWNALEGGDWSRALEINFDFILPVFKAILLQNHPAPIKRMMALTGHPVGSAREPLEPPSAEAEAKMKEAVLQAIRQVGQLKVLGDMLEVSQVKRQRKSK